MADRRSATSDWERAARWLGSRGVITAALLSIPAGWLVGWSMQVLGADNDAAGAAAVVGVGAFGVAYVACRLWAGKQVADGRFSPDTAPWRASPPEASRATTASQSRPAPVEDEPLLEASCELVPLTGSGQPGGPATVRAYRDWMRVDTVLGPQVTLRWEHAKHYYDADIPTEYPSRVASEP